MPRRGQSGKVGHGRAAHESDFGRRIESQNRVQPVTADFFERARDRRGDLQDRVLIPGAC
jgi:hypothetical protein